MGNTQTPRVKDTDRDDHDTSDSRAVVVSHRQHHQFIDMRILGVGLAAWASAAGSIMVGTRMSLLHSSAWAIGGLAAASVITVRLARDKKSHTRTRHRATLEILGVVCLCMCARTLHLVGEYHQHPIHAMIAGQVQVRCQGQTTSLPTTNSFGKTRIEALMNSCQSPTQEFDLPTSIVLSIDSTQSLELGQNIDITGRLRPSEWMRPPVAGELRVHVIHSAYISSSIHRFSAQLRQSLKEHTASHSHSVSILVPGMALGDKTAMTQEERLAFRSASLSHIVVISGFHLGIIVAMLSMIVPGRGLASSGILILMMAIASVVVGSGASVSRAFWMGTMVVLGRLWGKGSQPSSALGSAMMLMILCDPWQAISPGFCLSVAATLGVLIPARINVERIQRALRPSKGKNILARFGWIMGQTSIVSVWAQLSVIPVAVVFGMPVAPWGLLANIAVAPAIPLACTLSLLAAFASKIAPSLAHILLWCCELPCQWINAVAQWCAQRQHALLVVPNWICICLVAVGILLWKLKSWQVSKTPSTCQT